MLRQRLVAAVVVALLAATVQATGLVAQAELDSVDARFALRGDEPARHDIALVLVDDVTFSELNEQWPFARARHARVIDRLRRDGARLVVYDVVFDQPERGCRPAVDPDASACDGDAALLEAAYAARPTVFGVSASDPRKGPSLFGGGDIIAQVGAKPGTVQFPADRGGVLRRAVWGDAGIPSLATAASEVVRGRKIRPGDFPQDGEALIDYAGGPGSYPKTSFSRVLSGRFAPGTFKDKIVVVGTEDPRLKDVFPVPTSGGAVMSGAEVHANAIATILDGFPLRQAPAWLEVLAAALLGGLIPAVASAARFRAAVLVAAASAAGWPLVVQWQFAEGLVLPFVAPMIGLALGVLAATGGHAVMQSAERARTRGVFERFVGGAVVDEVLQDAGGEARLGGRRAHATVMFCDLREFTTFAERREPDEVIAVLNYYLAEMSDAILDHGGTLVSYMGDGIMAVFGAPLAQADHADRALGAAREMTGPALGRCNDWLRERGDPGNFRMGVGLNTGMVMSGTVGSARRMEYTALGDTTNVASRIEALAPGLGRSVLLSEATRAALRDEPADLVPLGEHLLRGRKDPVCLWSPA